MKSSSVKSTKCEHVFDKYDPYHLFLLSLQAIISTKVLSVRMMRCVRMTIYICFHLVDLARLYQSKQIGETKIIVFFPSLSIIAGPFPLLLVRIGN